MPITLEKKISPDGRADAWDIKQVKVALNRLGYYVPDKKEGMGADWDEAFTRALKNFQRAHFILPDGVIVPDDATHRALNAALEDQEEHSEFFARFYVWKTVGDGKVRGEHAARHGKQFAWDAPPDGEYPGEDFNCRCWAEPLIPSAPPRFRPKGLKAGLNDLLTPVPLDAIHPTIGPFDFIGGGAVVKGIAKALGKKIVTKYGGKIEKQIIKRGWTIEDVQKTISNPARKVKTKDIRHSKVEGERNNDPATAYFDKQGHYVVRNNKTGDIVQVSDKTKKGWKPSF